MKRKWNLQLFEDGGEGGNAQGAHGGNAGHDGGTAGATYSFEQAEEIANARADRASRAALTSFFKQQGMTQDEITQAIADFKDKQRASQPNVAQITQERDDARKELETIKNTQVLRDLGVQTDDVDYVTFKVAALMQQDNKLDFKKAADKFLKENPRFKGSAAGYRIKTGVDGSGSGSSQNANDVINDAIRKAASR